MDAPTLSYLGPSRGLPHSTDLFAAKLLRACAWFLFIFCFFFAVALTDQYLLVPHFRSRFVAQSSGYALYRDYVDHYSFAWRRLVFVLPLVTMPAVLGVFYLYFARRLRHQHDRTAMRVAFLLAVLHTLAAAVCVLGFLVIGSGGVWADGLSFRAILQFIVCLMAVLMVPGMIWTCVRLMDALSHRGSAAHTATPNTDPAPPSPSPPAESPPVET